MRGITMMIIAIVVLGGAYLLYGRYLQEANGELTQRQKLRHMEWKAELALYRQTQT